MDSLHKGAVTQLSVPGRAFKGLGVAKRYWGLSSNGTEMYAKGVDRYLPEMRLRRIQE